MYREPDHGNSFVGAQTPNCPEDFGNNPSKLISPSNCSIAYYSQPNKENSTQQYIDDQDRSISVCGSRTALQNGTSNNVALPNDAEKLYTLGYEARKVGNYKNAISYYSKAIEKNPKFFKAIFNRGFAFDKTGEYDKAISDYSKALEIEPKNAFVYYNRGISMDKLQRFDDAIYNFSMAITLDPSKADFYHNRGFAFRKKLDYEKAIQDYSKAIEIYPKHFKVSSFYQNK